MRSPGALLLIILLLWIPFVAIAQLDHKVTTGIVAYQQQDFERALTALNEALKDETKLKAKNISKAYYYRGKTYLGLLMQAAVKKDLESLAKYKGGYIAAFNDFISAIEKDSEQRWASKVEAELLSLKNQLLQAGMNYLNATNSEQYNVAELQTATKEAKTYLNAVIKIDPDNYTAHDLLAQVLINNKEYPTALAGFEKATQLYVQNPPEKPDLLIAYAYYRQGLIYRYYLHNPEELYAPKENLDKTLAVILQGQQTLEKEYQRMAANKDSYDAGDWEKLDEQYIYAKDDLWKFELDLYLNTPHLANEAVAKFETAIKKEPNNYTLCVAYASLVEKKDPEKAETLYKKAIAIDATQETAPFNLGVLIVNKGVEKYNIANEEADFNKADAIKKEGDVFFKQAKPFLEHALKANPNSLEAVSALKQVTITLGLDSEYLKYQDLEKKLKGK